MMMMILKSAKYSGMAFPESFALGGYLHTLKMVELFEKFSI